MRRVGLLFIFISLFQILSAQQFNFDFENLILPDTGFWNGADTTYYNGGFGDDNIYFYNSFTSSSWGDYWSGFAFSSWTDTTTEGYENQWSVYAGISYSGDIFGLGYVPTDWNTYETIPIGCKFSQAFYPISIQLTNSTYTALAIKNGTNYSEPFADGDYYYVKITGYYNGDSTKSIIHFLADYRNGQTFVQKNWQQVDLTPLGLVDSITFDVFSTDTGSYGINTPAYFCFDDFVYSTQAPAKTQNFAVYKIYPNPTAQYLFVNAQDFIKLEIYNNQGQKILETNQKQIDVSKLTAGVYLIRIQTKQSLINDKFVKE